jgi:hypothetical protein
MLLDGWVVEFDLEIGISLLAIHSHKIKKKSLHFCTSRIQDPDRMVNIFDMEIVISHSV